MGCNNIFYNNCVIKKGVQIGNENIFEVGTIIGAFPRERIMGTSKEKPITFSPIVTIGSNNYFEAYSVVQSPLECMTRIGNNICVGAFSHISHDANLYNEVTIASHCAVAGYCIIFDCANLGMGSILHQRSVVGAYAMIGAGSVVVNHIAPAATVAGIPAHYLHINRIGLERRGIPPEAIDATENWLSHACDNLLLPQYLSEKYDQFKYSLRLWNREKAIIPMR